MRRELRSHPSLAFFFVFLLALILLALAVAACSRTSGDGATGGGGTGGTSDRQTTPATATPGSPAGSRELVIAIKGEPTGLDAQRNEDGNMRFATENIYQALYWADGQTLKPELQLAESGRQIDDNTWEFTIKQGIKFSNGNDLTADDVAWSINRILSEELNSAIISNFETFERAEAIDETTVRLWTTSPDPVVPERLTQLKILDRETFEGQDLEYAQRNAIGTGPYVIEDWQRGVQMTLVPNEQYQGEVRYDRVTLRFIEEDQTRLSALLAGEVDIAAFMIPEYADQMPVTKTAPGFEYSSILINRFSGVFRNQDLAMAAVLAVDRQAIADNLFLGYADPYPVQMYPPETFGYNDDLEPFPYDPDRARALMEKAGYNGEPVQLIGENGRFLKDGETTEAVAQMLRDVGFHVELRIVSFADWLDVLFHRDKSPDLLYLSHTNFTFEPQRTIANYVLTSGPGSKYHDGLDELIRQAAITADFEEREKMYRQIDETLYEDPAWIPLVRTDDIYGMRENIDWEPRRDQVILFDFVRKN